MNWAALRTSAALAALFLVVYGGVNAFTATRADVGTWYYEWERGIPFVPAMVWPYMSIDLFFVAAPFVCTAGGRRVLVRRLVMAIGVAGVCFLVWPLRFAFERPAAEGLAGWVFDWFRTVDRPFNLFPSLHVAQGVILAGVYWGVTRGWVRAVVAGWFVLIGASTVLTYQHHVIDVVGGLVLGVACMYLFDEGALRQEVVPNRRVGGYYAAGAGVLAAVAVGMSGWWLVLLYPAVSLGVCAAAQWWLGPGIFRKSGGVMSGAARVVLGPVLVGQWLSLRHYARRSRAWDRVAEGVLLGRKLSEGEARRAKGEGGVTAVLDLAAEFGAARAFREGVAYRQLSVLDLTAPTAGQLREAVEFVEEEVGRGGTVYVHCKAGYSRSAAVAGAYLLSAGLVGDVGEAVAVLRAARPGIVIRPEIAAALQGFAAGMPDLAQRTRRRSMAKSARMVSTSQAT